MTEPDAPLTRDEALVLLSYYQAIGVDAALDPDPCNWADLRRAPPPPIQAPLSGPPPQHVGSPASAAPGSAALGAAEAVADARALLKDVTSLEQLKAALESFDGSPLKQTAMRCVFADGVVDAPLMVIGEAPGADEDRQGLPFVGAAGQLLDRMLTAIGRSRTRDVYITNILPWRPPGNRTPTAAEIATFTPFIERHVALKRPQLILALGGTAAKALLRSTDGITRLRGRLRDYGAETGEPDLQSRPIPLLASFHPAFLLRSPIKKRDTWSDLLAAKAQLDGG